MNVVSDDPGPSGKIVDFSNTKIAIEETNNANEKLYSIFILNAFER